MGYTCGTEVVRNDLIFYVDAANHKSYVSDSTIVNSFMGGYSGSFQGSTLPTFTTSSLGSWEFSGNVNNQKINFNETATSTFTSSLDPQLNSFTANIFFKIDPNAPNTSGVIFSKGNKSSNRVGWLMYYNKPQGTLYIRCCGEELNSNQRSSRSYSIDTDRVYMATLVIDREQNKFFGYLDGKNPSGGFASMLESPEYITPFGSIIAPKPLLMGTRDDNSLPLKGNIYLAQIYNRALSPKEVLKNYNALGGRFN